MAIAVVNAKREVLKACLTCSICKKLLKDATTISECLHTFCRKCIYDKFTDEELESCPICNIDLGVSPIEKLRPDHSLQDVRAKIFPLRTRKINAPEVPPSAISLPTKRKERSLSSLVVNTPRVAIQSSITGRRTKAVAGKAGALRGLSPSVDDSSIKREYIEDFEDREEESSSSQEERLNKTLRRHVMQKSTSGHAESSNHLSNKEMETYADKSDLWKPLNCLVEAANRTKSTKYNGPQMLAAKMEQQNGPDSEMNAHKSMRKEHYLIKHKVQEENNNNATNSVSAKTKKSIGSSRKRAASTKDASSSAQALVDASSVRRERGTGSIWLSLIASSDQEGCAALPQIPLRYLRTKDGNLPASFIQKYLAKKLDLPTESEVDITCRGQPILPTLELHKLVDLWLPTGSSQKSQVTVGTSAKEFVMIVNYARRSPNASSS